MGLMKFMVSLMREIGEANGPMESKEESEAMLNRIKPKRTPTGILRIMGLILCPCGEITAIETEPPSFSEEEIKKLQEKLQKADPDAQFVDATPKEWEGKRSGNSVCLMSRAHTVDDCEKCGRRFVVAWEMDCASINPDMKIPWGDSESPDSPASGLSFPSNVGGNGTVH